MPTDASPAPGGLRGAFRALRHRDYRLFFFGQGVSLIGTWMQHTALGWLIFKITGSEVLLGAVAFAGQIPIFLLAPLAGVMADRWDQRRILVAMQSLAMVQACVLSVLILTGTLATASDTWMIVALTVFLGTVNALEMPTRQSFVVRMVDDRADLSNAIALNSMLMNGSRLVGPAVAGLIVKFGSDWMAGWRIPNPGEAACFGLNFLSYAAVIAALLALRPAPHEARAVRRHPLHELHEGLVYAWRAPAIRLLLMFMAGLSLLGIPYAVLMPVFAKKILHGDAQTLGSLMSSVGVGAVVGTALLASRRNPLGLGRLMVVAGALFGCALIAFSFSRTIWLSMLILTVTGFGLVSQVVSGNTLLQTLVDDDKRGRIMGLHAVAFLGMMPFGSLAGGWAAKHWGAPRTVLICGIATILGAIVFSTRLGTLNRALARAHARQPIPSVGPPGLGGA